MRADFWFSPFGLCPINPDGIKVGVPLHEVRSETRGVQVLAQNPEPKLCTPRIFAIQPSSSDIKLKALIVFVGTRYK